MAYTDYFNPEVWEQLSPEEQEWVRGRLGDLPFGIGERLVEYLPALPEELEPWEEPFEEPAPTLQLPRYQPYTAPYPTRELPIYDPFTVPYPELKLPRYEAFPVEFPTLGPLYGEAGDVISRLLSGEYVEGLMEPYIAAEQQVMKEYMPALREHWAGRDLLRSGMEREAEREAVTKAGIARGTYRAELEKEGIITGLNMAMQHVGLGYGAQKDAWNAAMNEYTKVFASEVAAGLAEHEASTRAWDAALNEYTKVFTSQLGATQFAQGIAEKSFASAKGEYTKVYESAFAGTGSEYQASWQAWQAAQAEYARIQQMGFQQMMWELEADLRRELAAMGYDAQQTSSIWGAIGTIIGSIIIGIL